MYPPGEAPGYLAQAFFLVWRNAGLAQLKSVCILTDASGPHGGRYLAPVLRFAEWDRTADLRARDLAPHLSLTFAHCRNWRAIQAITKALHHQCRSLPFEPVGISRTRRGPKLAVDGTHDSFAVRLSNGAQHVEFASDALAGDPTTALLRSSLAQLRAQAEFFSADGWLEAHGTALDPKAHFKWIIGEQSLTPPPSFEV
jgi:hypothetical protein